MFVTADDSLYYHFIFGISLICDKLLLLVCGEIELEELMKNAKKLQQINQKIADLKILQKKLEDDFVKDLSVQVMKIIRKRNLFDLDKSKILECVENAFNELFEKSKK